MILIIIVTLFQMGCVVTMTLLFIIVICVTQTTMILCTIIDACLTHDDSCA